MSNLGTTHATKLLYFFAAIGMAFDKTFKDSKFTWDDIFNFLPAQADAPKTKEEWAAAWDELKDLDATERAELTAKLRDRLDLSSDKLESLIEDTQAIGFDFWNYLEKHFLSDRSAA